MKATWTVAVIYENEETREAGIAFCDCLAQKFWTRFGFDVSWWPFQLLSDASGANEALKRAVEADFLIFSSSAQSEPPKHVRGWIEQWVSLRGEREGALVGLPLTGADDLAAPAQLHLYLRDVAHRAGVDYLTEVPQNIGQLIPDSPDFFAERAQTVTHVLDGILQQQHTRPQWP